MLCGMRTKFCACGCPKRDTHRTDGVVVMPHWHAPHRAVDCTDNNCTCMPTGQCHMLLMATRLEMPLAPAEHPFCSGPHNCVAARQHSQDTCTQCYAPSPQLVWHLYHQSSSMTMHCFFRAIACPCSLRLHCSPRGAAVFFGEK